MYVRADFVPRVSQVNDGEGYVFRKVPDFSPRWQQQQYMTGSAHISTRILLEEGGNGFKIISWKRDIYCAAHFIHFLLCKSCQTKLSTSVVW